jgi:purine-binding chemotaxis protein CheW
MQDNEFDDDDDDFEDTQKDKYLLFNTNNEEYGIDIKFVREIVGIHKIIQVPNTESYIKGVINLRGKIIPVLDIRIRFNLEFKDYNNRTCIIIIDIDGKLFGLIVDNVSEVLVITEDKLELPPQSNKSSKNKYIKNLGKVGDKVKIILDVEHILKYDDLDGLDKNIIDE